MPIAWSPARFELAAPLYVTVGGGGFGGLGGNKLAHKGSTRAFNSRNKVVVTNDKSSSGMQSELAQTKSPARRHGFALPPGSINNHDFRRRLPGRRGGRRYLNRQPPNHQ